MKKSLSNLMLGSFMMVNALPASANTNVPECEISSDLVAIIIDKEGVRYVVGQDNPIEIIGDHYDHLDSVLPLLDAFELGYLNESDRGFFTSADNSFSDSEDARNQFIKNDSENSILMSQSRVYISLGNEKYDFDWRDPVESAIFDNHYIINDLFVNKLVNTARSVRLSYERFRQDCSIATTNLSLQDGMLRPSATNTP